MRHFIGDFDGMAFLPYAEYAAGHPTDFGPDDYAGITWTNTPAAPCVLIGWMNDWSYADKTPTSDWKGAILCLVNSRLSVRKAGCGSRKRRSQICKPFGRNRSDGSKSHLMERGRHSLKRQAKRLKSWQSSRFAMRRK